MKSVWVVILTMALCLALAACNLPGLGAPTTLPSGDLEATLMSSAAKTAAAILTSVPTPVATTPAPSPPVFPQVANPALTYFRMQDAQNGWGLASGVILRTRDGALTWEDVSPPGKIPAGSALSGYFQDAGHAWVLVPSADFTSGTFLRTADQGQTWQSFAAPFAAGRLQFLDALNGWALVETGAGAGSAAVDIYQTQDGGETWAKVYSIDPATAGNPGQLPFTGMKNGMTFRDATHGWVGGSQPQNAYVWLFATQDGGRTWQHQDLRLPAGYEQAMTSVDAPIFFNQQDGVLPVALYSGDTIARIFYQTTDGGTTWNPTQAVLNRGVYEVVSMFDYWVWDGVNIAVTHDGGRSWNTFTPNINLDQTIASLDFVDNNLGWVTSMDASGRVQIYRTLNGGLTWAPPGQTPPTPAAPTSVPATATPTPTSVPAASPTVSFAGPSARKGVSIPAVRLTKKPVIDGQLDEWSLTRYPVNNVVFGKSNWSGSSDLNAKAMFGWNDDFLFIAVRVWDDVHVQNATGENLFKGDSVEVLFDVNVSADYYRKELSADDYQIGVSPGSDSVAPEAYLWFPKSKAGSLDKVKIGAFITDDGYKMEIAIPWSLFGVNPRAGQHYGFAFSISDNDNPDKNVQQTMTSIIPTRVLTDPTTWGDLVLK